MYKENSNEISEIIKEIREKITSRGDLPHISVKKQSELLEDLSSFSLGRFFLENKSADGYWTDYIINHPQTGGKTGLNSDGNAFSFVEKFILEKAPLTLATRERFDIFQKNTHKLLKNDMKIASIPCGVMRDLLSLNYKNLSFSIVGLDLDLNSIKLAEKLASHYKLSNHVDLLQGDAWNLPFQEELDLITSSGLNVYVSEEKKLEELYKEFYRSLKKGGHLVTAVLTYPPGFSKKSEWILDRLPEENLLMEKVLFQDILGCKWRNFRSVDEIYKDFRSVGFIDVEIVFDSFRIFPTVIAKK